jgi:hypothetical protein
VGAGAVFLQPEADTDITVAMAALVSTETVVSIHPLFMEREDIHHWV